MPVYPFCPFCGAQAGASGTFCPKCGKQIPMLPEEPVVQPAAEPAPVEPAAKPAKAKKPGKKKKVILFSLLGLVLVATVAAGLWWWLGGKQTKTDSVTDYCVYMKGDKLYYTGPELDEPVQLDVPLYGRVLVSRDGKRVFRGPNHIENVDSTGMDPEEFRKLQESLPKLYYCDVSDPNMEPVLISEWVTQYEIDPHGTRVVYLTLDKTLCSYDVASGKTEQIATDCPYGFGGTEDLRKIYYKNGESYESYIWSIETGAVKTPIRSVSMSPGFHLDPYGWTTYATPDFSYVLYEGAEGVYRWDAQSGESIKIADDIWWGIWSLHAKITSLYDSGQAYYIEPIYGESGTSYELYFFDGEKSCFLGQWQGLSRGDGLDLVTETYDATQDWAERVATFAYAKETPVAAFRTETGAFVAIGAQVYPLEHADAKYFSVTKDGTQVSYCANIRGSDFRDMVGDLYTVSIQDGTIGKPVLRVRGVNARYAAFAPSGDLIYEGRFVNGTDMGEVNSKYYTIGYDNFLLYTAGEDNTLKLYRDGKETEILPHATSYAVTHKDNVVCLDQSGNLYLHKNGKTVRLDTGVSDIITPEPYLY